MALLLTSFPPPERIQSTLEWKGGDLRPQSPSLPSRLPHTLPRNRWSPRNPGIVFLDLPSSARAVILSQLLSRGCCPVLTLPPGTRCPLSQNPPVPRQFNALTTSLTAGGQDSARLSFLPYERLLPPSKPKPHLLQEGFVSPEYTLITPLTPWFLFLNTT